MKQKAKNVLGNRIFFLNFLNILRMEMSSGLEFWQASRGLKAAHRRFFDPKSERFEGSRMLGYGVIRD